MGRTYGSEIYTIDHKGRVSVPVALRRASGRRRLEYVLSRGLDNCLWLFTPEQWSAYEQKLNAIPYGDPAGRAFVRSVYAHTVGPLIPDAQGRITIPAHLLALAGLEKDARFLITGDKIEIWNPQRYDAVIQANADAMDVHAERVMGGNRP
jgi:MraZ protein